ncbi:MAG: hypothetical protein AAFX00_14585, partial [Pseudomonadota bacterium]
MKKMLLALGLGLSCTTVQACATLDVVLCEDFETVAPGGLPDPDVWKMDVRDGNEIVVENTRAARGAQSIRVTTNARWAYIRTRNPFPELESKHWGRLYFLIQDPRPDTEALVHWNLVEAVGEEDPQKLFRIGGIS